VLGLLFLHGSLAFLTLCSAARCVVAKDAGEGASG